MSAYLHACMSACLPFCLSSVCRFVSVMARGVWQVAQIQRVVGYPTPRSLEVQLLAVPANTTEHTMLVNLTACRMVCV
jgi:hypothetical protein